MSLDGLADVLAHLYELRIIIAALQTSVDGLDERLIALAGGIVSENVHGDFAAVEQTERIVERVNLVAEADGLSFVRTFGSNEFAQFGRIFARLHVGFLEILTSFVRLHYSRITIYAIYEALEENFLVDGPRLVASQTIFLEFLYCLRDVMTYAINLTAFFYFAIPTALEGIHKLCDSFISFFLF